MRKSTKTDDLKREAIQSVVGDMSFSNVTVSPFAVLPNALRGLELNEDGSFADGEYHLIPNKVAVVAESIKQTGFWSGVEARMVDGKYEIAFGHHRIAAAQALGLTSIPLTVRDYSDEQMFLLMANENMFDSDTEHQGEHDRMVVEYVRNKLNAGLEWLLDPALDVMWVNGSHNIKQKAIGDLDIPFSIVADYRACLEHYTAEGMTEADARLEISVRSKAGATTDDVRSALGSKIWSAARVRNALAALPDSYFARRMLAKIEAETAVLSERKAAREEWQAKVDAVASLASKAKTISVPASTAKHMTEAQTAEAEGYIAQIVSAASEVLSATPQYPDVPVLKTAEASGKLVALIEGINTSIEDDVQRQRAVVETTRKNVIAAQSSVTAMLDRVAGAVVQAKAMWVNTSHTPTKYEGHYPASIAEVSASITLLLDGVEVIKAARADLAALGSITAQNIEAASAVVARASDLKPLNDLGDLIMAAARASRAAEAAYLADLKTSAISSEGVTYFKENVVQAKYRIELEKVRGDMGLYAFVEAWPHERQVELADTIVKSMAVSSDTAGKFDKISTLRPEATVTNRLSEMMRGGYLDLIIEVGVEAIYAPTSKQGSSPTGRLGVLYTLKNWAAVTKAGNLKGNPLEGVPFPSSTDIIKVFKDVSHGVHHVTAFEKLLGNDETKKSNYVIQQTDALDEDMMRVVSSLQAASFAAASCRDRLATNLNKANLVSQHEQSVIVAAKHFADIMGQINELRKTRDENGDPTLSLTKSA